MDNFVIKLKKDGKIFVYSKYKDGSTGFISTPNANETTPVYFNKKDADNIIPSIEKKFPDFKVTRTNMDNFNLDEMINKLHDLSVLAQNTENINEKKDIVNKIKTILGNNKDNIVSKLKEMSTSGNAGSYLTKYAFVRKTLKEMNFDSDEEIINTLSSQIKGEKPKPKPVRPNVIEPINEGYNSFKKQVTTRTPGSTSQAVMRTVRRKLKEIENVIHYSSRIREEIGKTNINPEVIKELTLKLKEITKKIQNFK